ncbi:Glycosyl transferase, family 20 [Cynara cardunculus var. scolymus]|uniref:Glycosyl transferase, family 20 n=1 Tax=Cynara cardunculus var. scolymus TaxID=59895 RepID=A0A103Y2J1_CYNCS|nr:Glycosyl transferase, family 20 [Cynara cardunculus var. scolymus]
MLSRSSFNLLNLEDYSSVVDRPRIPRIMTVPGILSEFEEDDNGRIAHQTDHLSDVISSVSAGRRIVVSNQLPVKARFDARINKWVFQYDPDALVLQLKSGLGSDTECVYVGSLPVDVPPSDQEEVAQTLLEKFRCVPTFLSLEIQNKFYHGFCKHYLWPLFHYMLPVTRTHGVRFDRVAWQAYVSANKVFTDKVMEVINPDEDYVWIHDYHLMVMPTFLRKRFHRIRVGFFLHSPFPSSEIYRTLPVRDEILRALLNCDLIGFHTFDYARHFLSCCSRMLGLDYKSKRGYIGLEYYGRTVSIKILPVGIHMGQIESVKSSPETATKVEELRRKYDGKVVVLGVDDMDMFKGISLKFLAMGQLLEDYPGLRGSVVLVQIVNPARSRGHDIQKVKTETMKVANEVNQRFDQDLERACKEHFHKRCWGIGLGLSFRVVALGPNFRKLSIEHIVSSYNKTNSRLILLDYDGTIMPRALVDKTPSKEVISVLNALSNDPKNVVFIVSGRGKDSLGKWFNSCQKLGLSAEHGYFTRWNGDSEWESCGLTVDVGWKKVALPVMEHYTEATDGSFIEQKESALVWHHQEADPDFGTWQAKELLDHLESVLANEPVVVKRGQQIVEVNPQGVGKGVVVDRLVTTMQNNGKPLDFILCIGDDQSDEDMFEKVSSSVANGIAEVFACTVGQKPSMAKYYLDDTVDVIKMLHGLEATSAHVSKSIGFHVETRN